MPDFLAQKFCKDCRHFDVSDPTMEPLCKWGKDLKHPVHGTLLPPLIAETVRTLICGYVNPRYYEKRDGS